MSEALFELKKIRAMAYETDYIMPLWLPFTPLVLFLAGLVAAGTSRAFLARSKMGFHTALSAPVMPLTALFLIIVALVIDLYVIYKWIDRRNKHFRRSRLFFNTILSFIRGKGVDDAQARTLLREMELFEEEKNPVIYVVLLLILGLLPGVNIIAAPLLNLYIYYFLMKDFFNHSRREVMLSEQVEKALREIGVNPPPHRLESLPSRSFIIYLVLTVLTLGLFGFYWIYVLTNDPNNHFRNHALYEGDLISVFHGVS